VQEWKATACMLCENNCGIEAQLSEDGQSIAKIRGDDLHPASQGYVCQKASRIDFYQNGVDRIKQPLRRTASGDYEEISWETAIKEIAGKMVAVKNRFGGDKIFYYGGGGQGNHLPASYGMSTISALGGRYRSNALAQEKTGEGWVSASMFGAYVQRGDFENCDVAVFLGKNPWHSHGIQKGRVALREIAKDPKRTLVVFDPRVSETAEIADIHIRLKPGTDAWALAALIAIMLEENWTKQAWIDKHVSGFSEMSDIFSQVNIGKYCDWAGINQEQMRQLAQILFASDKISWFEDLGVQMSRNSTLVSYLHRLCWLVTGSFGKEGSQYIPNTMRPLMAINPSLAKRSPVVGAPLLGGMVPCNVIAEEILSDHPDRYRAMLIESANPAHSLADTKMFVKSMAALELTVVIDVAMTETARHADYVLPAKTQYEKAEATFFNFEHPANYFQLRQPILEPPSDANVLSEAEIHARLVEAIGEMPSEMHALREVVKSQGLLSFLKKFTKASRENPMLSRLAPVVLYRILENILPPGCETAATLLPVTLFVAQKEPECLERAGVSGHDAEEIAVSLFNKIISNPHGFIYSIDADHSSWDRVSTQNKLINAAIPILIPELVALATGPMELTSAQFPLILSAGERRAYTANTILRGKHWRRKDTEGALRISPEDASDLGVDTGDSRILTTPSGAVTVTVEISNRMARGHISLPNGFGLDSGAGSNSLLRTGVATNDLTASTDRDFLAATPRHKQVPARLSRAN
jgi:anaerobic selenocysteine-containing dehydrogenase